MQMEQPMQPQGQPMPPEMMPPQGMPQWKRVTL
jgi:hypothetical protein